MLPIEDQPELLDDMAADCKPCLPDGYTITVDRTWYGFRARVVTIGIGKAETPPTFRRRNASAATQRAERWCSKHHDRQRPSHHSTYRFFPDRDGGRNQRRREDLSDQEACPS